MGTRLLIPVTAALLLAAPLARAQTIPNPSFEANTFTVFPGYAINNGSGISGWVINGAAQIGLNPAGGNPFADNGAIPDGTNVAFVQSDAALPRDLTTTITGLTPGVEYEVSFRANSRAATAAPNASWSLNGGAFVPFTASPAVGVGNPYYTVIGSFKATSATAALSIRNQTASDSALLIDDFRMVARQVPGSTWTVSRWAGDASTSLSTALTLWAYRFGSATGTNINGVAVNGVAGGNPSVPNRFAISGPDSVFPGDVNELTVLTNSGSAEMARNFIYNGNPATITLQGLTVGQGYRVSLFGMGFGDARPQNFASGSDQRVMEEGALGNDKGVRIDHSFVATATNRVITITPTTPATFHLYGMALHLNSTVTTLPFSRVVNGEAIFNGTANPAGQPSTVWFEWGTAGAPFSQQSTPQSVGGGTNAVTFQDDVSGLQSNVYQVRAVLANASGTLYADPYTFQPGVTNVVTNTNDSGPGSLRQSLAGAASGDTIAFAPGLNGQTILLTSGELTLNRSLTVDASMLPQGLTLDGNQSSRILSVATNTAVRLDSLTLRNGRVAGVGSAILGGGFGSVEVGDSGMGGAIYNRGAMTLRRVRLANNSAIGISRTIPASTTYFYCGAGMGGAIYNYGALTLRECVLEANLAQGGGANPNLGANITGGSGAGGGIYNAGRLVLDKTSLVGNTAQGGVAPSYGAIIPGYGPSGNGGGFYNVGSAVIHQCTLAENQAHGVGLADDKFAPSALGGADTFLAGTGGNGGGIYNGKDGDLTLNQSTISRNQASTRWVDDTLAADPTFTLELILAAAASQNLEISTGGGIANYGRNGVEAAPTYGGFGTLKLFNSIVAGNTALYTTNLANLATTNTHFTDLGGNLLDGDPRLSPLDASGVGALPVLLPLFGSPAINAGLNSATNLYVTDQRGASRFVGATVDIGAVEYPISTTPNPSIGTLSYSVLSSNPVTGARIVRLSASFMTDGAGATARFEHGLTTSYGQTNAIPSFGSYNTPLTFTTDIQLGTQIPYNWRVVMESSAGNRVSANQIVFIPGPGLLGDQNGDGVVSQSELDTVYANYLPTSPWLALTNVAGLGGTNVTFALEGSPLGAYTVEYSTNLVDWLPLGPATPRYGFTDTNAPALPQRHYRLRYP